MFDAEADQKLTHFQSPNPFKSTIQATWTLEPVEIDGNPEAVCTSVTFLGH